MSGAQVAGVNPEPEVEPTASERADNIAAEAAIVAAIAEGVAERAAETAAEIEAEETAAAIVEQTEIVAAEAAAIAVQQSEGRAEQWQQMMQAQMAELGQMIQVQELRIQEMMGGILATLQALSEPAPADTSGIAPATSAPQSEAVTVEGPPLDPQAEVPAEPAPKAEPQKPRRNWI